MAGMDLAFHRLRGRFEGTRPDCFINMIPAGGVVVQVEASSGCSCYHAMQSTTVFISRPPVKAAAP